MVIGADSHLAPIGMDEGFRGQRLQRRALDRLEQILPGGAEVAADAGIQPAQFLPDGRVQLNEGEELPVAQPRVTPQACLRHDDPALDQQDRSFDLCLVPRLAGPRRQNGGAVMGSHVGIAAVDLRLAEARADHAGLEVVGHDQRWRPAAECKGPRMGADPVRQRLAPARLGIGHVRCAHHRNKELCGPRRAGRQVDHRHRRAGVIDEHSLPGDMALAHHRRQATGPAAVVLAKGRIGVAVRMQAPIFVPQKRQRHAGPFQLTVDRRPIRFGKSAILWRRKGRKQPFLKGRLIQPFSHRPRQLSRLRAAQIFRHCASPHADAQPDLAGGAASCVKPQYILDLPHRQPSHLASVHIETRHDRQLQIAPQAPIRG